MILCPQFHIPIAVSLASPVAVTQADPAVKVRLNFFGPVWRPLLKEYWKEK